MKDLDAAIWKLLVSFADSILAAEKRKPNWTEPEREAFERANPKEIGESTVRVAAAFERGDLNP